MTISFDLGMMSPKVAGVVATTLKGRTFLKIQPEVTEVVEGVSRVTISTDRHGTNRDDLVTCAIHILAMELRFAKDAAVDAEMAAFRTI